MLEARGERFARQERQHRDRERHGADTVWTTDLDALGIGQE